MSAKDFIHKMSRTRKALLQEVIAGEERNK